MKRFIFLLLLLLLFLLSGCSHERKYELRQTFDCIQAIELLYVSPYDSYTNKQFLEMEAITSVDKNNWEDLVNEIENTSCKAYFHDPSWSISQSVVRITYQDETVELICAKGGLYYSANDWKYRYLYFDEDEFQSIIDDFTMIAVAQ